MSAYGWLAADGYCWLLMVADGYWWLAIENLHSCCLNPQIQRRHLIWSAFQQTKQPRQEWWGHALGAFRKGLGRIVICCVLWKAVEVRGLDHVITPIICVEINYESNVKSDGEKEDMVPKSVQGTKSIHDLVIKTAIQPAMCQRPKSFESCTSVAGRMTRDTVCGSSSGWKQSCLKEVVLGPTLELSADTLLLRSRNLFLQRWSVLPGRLDWGWTWRSPTWP